MRALKTSISQRRQQSTDTHQLELQTPSKQKFGSFTQQNFFSPSNTFYHNGGFSSTQHKSPGSYYGIGGSTQNVNTSQGENIHCDTILLSSSQKSNAVQHLQGLTSSQKPGSSSSSHKLNFLGSTNKNNYVDIKRKRINDLNTIYTEGNQTDFNSQNVFLNKLVYQANSAAAVGVQQNQAQYSTQNSNKQSSGRATTAAEQSENQQNNNYIVFNRSSQKKFVSQNSFTGSEFGQPNIAQFQSTSALKSQAKFDGLENFVKTMYKGGASGFNQSKASFHPGQTNKTFFSQANSQREYDSGFHAEQSQQQDEKEVFQVKPNTYKMKDLFITKINNTFITPKYIQFQNQPSSKKFLKRNSLLDKNAQNYQNSILQQKTTENQSYAVQNNADIGMSSQMPQLKAQNSVDSYQQFQVPKLDESNHDGGNHNNKLLSTHSQLQMDFPDYYSRDGKDDQEDAYLKDKKYKPKNKRNHTQSMQSSMITEFQLPDNLIWNFEYLFIFINNLSQVKRKNNLKYTFLQIPQIQNMMRQSKLQTDYIGLKEELKTRLQINSKDIYLFFDDGSPINSHMDIIRSENKERRAIFVGGSGGFCGVVNLFISNEMKSNLIKVINGLIDQSLRLQEKKFQQKDDSEQSQNHIGQTRPSTQGSQSQFHSQNKLNQKLGSCKDLESVRCEEFQTKEQFLRKQNKEIVDKVVNILTHNPNAKIKRLEQGVDNPRIRQLQKIEDLYDQQIRDFKKSGLEVEATSSLGDNPEKQQTKNLRQIAEYIDEFLDQNFPQANQPIKRVIDQYSSLVNNMQQKPSTKRNFVKENIQKFNSPYMAMKYIQNINRELFVKNIPKVLSKYELSRHDLHSIYILYKALLTVSIQRIDWKEVAKGGIDFKTFEHGIDKISSQSEEIIRRMCNYENFIDWNQFIDILYAVSGKTLESKIDIFIKVADTDRGGTLSKEEISELCYICLDKILPKEGEDDSMVQGLVEFFTRLLFTSLDVDPEDDIPLHKLKNAIVEGHPENDLLCFFCGVDYTK